MNSDTESAKVERAAMFRRTWRKRAIGAGGTWFASTALTAHRPWAWLAGCHQPRPSSRRGEQHRAHHLISWSSLATLLARPHQCLFAWRDGLPNTEHRSPGQGRPAATDRGRPPRPRSQANPDFHHSVKSSRGPMTSWLPQCLYAYAEAGPREKRRGEHSGSQSQLLETQRVGDHAD